MGGGGEGYAIPLSHKAHARSDLESRWSRTLWGRNLCVRAPFSKSNMRRRNARPDRTTLRAWLRSPINDSSSRREQVVLSPQLDKTPWSRSSLSAGSLSMPSRVSISIPRNVSLVVGLSRLCSATGIPKRVQAVVGPLGTLGSSARPER